MIKICIDSKLGVVLHRLNDEQKGRLLSLLLADELPDEEDPIVWLAYEMGVETGLIKEVEA